MAFPSQWLVVGVPVTLGRRRVKKTCHSRSFGKIWRVRVMTRQSWHLNCHAWMTIIALVVTAWRN